MKEALLKDIMEYGEDIVSSERFAKAKTVPHHSKKHGTIAAHSLETAGYALRIARWVNRHGGSVDEKETVRASLLHDIGMTVDEVFLSPSPIKAKTHPIMGARIAKDEFGASDVQVDAILHHMWPFCYIVPPHSSVGFVLTTADKCCSLNEIRQRLSMRTKALLD